MIMRMITSAIQVHETDTVIQPKPTKHVATIISNATIDATQLLGRECQKVPSVRVIKIVVIAE